LPLGPGRERGGVLGCQQNRGHVDETINDGRCAMRCGASRSQSGFTLLELSVVLTIIAVVVGMSVSMGISMVATAHQSATQKKMKAIDDALLQYRIANDRLPCPGDLTIAQGATNYGVEAANPGTCTGGSPAANFTGTGVTNTFATAAEGGVPAVTLGLSPDFMFDGWGNRFRYAVDVSYTAASSFTYAGGTQCINGAITVNDGNGNARSTGSIYALISHGANGHGAYTTSGVTINGSSSSADELTNCHCNSSGVTTTSSGVQTTKPATYVQKLPQYDSGQAGNSLYYFDDLVSYKERWQLQTGWDKTTGCTYVYVTDPNNYRVEASTTGGNFAFGIGSGYQGVGGTVGTYGSGNGQFGSQYGTSPIGIATDANGNVYVLDTQNERVEKFSSNGTYISTPVTYGYGSGNGQAANVYSAVVDPSGNIWIDDLTNARVQEFSSTGTWIRTIGGDKGDGTHTCTQCASTTSCTCYSGSGIGQFSNWMGGGLASDSSGNIYVSDENNLRVQKFSNTGTYLQTFGGGSSCTSCTSASSCTCNWGNTGNGLFQTNLGGLAVDAGGNLYVVSSGTIGFAGVQKFNSGGAFVSQFGSSSTGSGNGQFNNPVNIAIDANSNLWITDNGNNRVQEFSNSGAYIGQFGTAGSSNGRFNGPQGIAVGSR
jgi:prepilin-type N-terminal cleavage/methylation domain-containing protein